MVERALADNAVQAGPFCSSGWNAVLSDFLGSSAFSVHSLHVRWPRALLRVRRTVITAGGTEQS